MDLIERYIGANYAIIIAVLYVVGLIIKRIDQFPNKYIPLLLSVLGIGLAVLSAFSRSAEYANTAALLFDSVVQGILCAGMSVYTHGNVKKCAV